MKDYHASAVQKITGAWTVALADGRQLGDARGPFDFVEELEATCFAEGWNGAVHFMDCAGKDAEIDRLRTILRYRLNPPEGKIKRLIRRIFRVGPKPVVSCDDDIFSGRTA